MHLPSLLGALTLLIASTCASSLPSTEIFYWPIGETQPSLLARVAYDPTSLHANVLTYNPPNTSPSQADGLVRLGVYTATPTNPKQWSGSVISRSALEHPPALRLHLGPGPAREVYHVSLASSKNEGEASVELVVSETGPQPHLNRPVVVRPDGGDAEEVPEKTLLQKYWWVGLILMFLTMSGGGGEGQ